MTRRRTMPRTSILLGLLALASGCSGGGQTGDSSGDHEPGTNGVSSPCEDEVSDIALDDASALGFSANSVLAFTAARFDSPITWQSIDGVQYSPGAGQSTLALTLTSAGSAEFVRSTLRPSSQESGPAAFPLCPSDRLRLPVHVELSTADGALLESFDGTVEADHAQIAQFSHTFELSALHGHFKVDAIDPSVLPGTGSSVQLTRLSLDASLSSAGVAGSFKAQATSTGTHVSGAVNLNFAHFP